MAHEANVLHADADSFYASVEQRDNPSLAGRPVLVGGGVVLAASYEAKEHGVKTAMSLSAARRLCPKAVVVPPRMKAYSDASKAMFAVFDDTTAFVEGLSIDEAFLEVGSLRRISGTPAQIAARLRQQVRERVGIPISVGVARTKFLAKVASGAAKPDGLLVVNPDAELEFLHPLPVESLWGVGKVTSAKLRAQGILTVGQVAAMREEDVIALLGPASGRHIHALSHNRDPRPVEVHRRRRSIGAQRALGRGHRPPQRLETDLTALVDRLARRLRGTDRTCRTVVLRLRFDDYARATRSRTLPQPTAGTQVILATAKDLLREALPLIAQRGITLIGVSLTNLGEAESQPQLAPYVRAGAVDLALDRVRDKYGSSSITRAVLLGRAEDPSVPLLPD